MAQAPLNRWLFGLFLVLTAASAGFAYGVEVDLKDETLPEAPTREEVALQVYADEEPESWTEFFKHRIKVGAGFDEEYNDNILLQDNKKQDEWTSTVEALLLFNDPRGSLLYGTSYEVNAFRLHRSDNNAVDHDFLVYVDYDPGGRLQLHGEYALATQHYLLFGDEEIDVLRRSSSFQEMLITTWRGKAQYALNSTNALVQQLTHSFMDDHTSSDENSDRKTLNFIADMDHDLTPTWVLFGGYIFEDSSLPKNPLKDSQSHGGRLGVRHSLTEIQDLTLTFTVQQVEFAEGSSSTNMGFTGKWMYELGPRTQLILKYNDGYGTSFSGARRQFRGRSPAANLKYELTPLIDLTASASYGLQASGSQEVKAGEEPIHAESQKRYGVGLGLDWRITENGSISFSYGYGRSPSRDTTSSRAAVGFETSF